VSGPAAGPALLAVFARADHLLAGLERVRARRLSFTVFSPTRDERIQEALALGPSPVRFFTLTGFVSGAAAGLALCAFTALRWKFIVSGKPVLAWVPFTVIAFELSILLGVLATLAGMLLVGRVPRLRLPDHYDPRFSGDRFGLLVRPGAEAEPVAAELRASGAEEVRAVDG
jgi:molybdopterin-containing oxidoreductase family membrane subunit